MIVPIRAVALCIVVGVAGCTAAPPNDVAEGVGFGDYETYQREQAAREAAAREAAARRAQAEREIIAPRVVSGETTGREITADPITSLAEAAIADAERGGPETVPTHTLASSETGTPSPSPSSGNAGISDEQDFEAVAARESIESDAERLARMQEQMVVIEPTAVPERPRDTGPNIIEYALATTHPVGQQVYRRTGVRAGRHEANCLSYRSDDLAQQAFLANGGPDRDREALDPDGDGYACGWNPEVYRQAARTAGSGG